MHKVLKCILHELLLWNIAETDYILIKHWSQDWFNYIEVGQTYKSNIKLKKRINHIEWKKNYDDGNCVRNKICFWRKILRQRTQNYIQQKFKRNLLLLNNIIKINGFNMHRDCDSEDLIDGIKVWFLTFSLRACDCIIGKKITRKRSYDCINYRCRHICKDQLNNWDGILHSRKKFEF